MLMLGVVACLVTSCHTMKGLGQDLQIAGRALSTSADKTMQKAGNNTPAAQPVVAPQTPDYNVPPPLHHNNY